MQFENISMHCENRHIVESCEITDTVAPDEVLMVQSSTDMLCYFLFMVALWNRADHYIFML